MKVFALCADYGYLDKVETTIKSILWHNPHSKIYLLNYDIPQEWFINVNQYANQIRAQIVDEKFDPSLLKGMKVDWQRLNLMTFARLLIPSLIPEKRVLYLDSDIVVNDQLEHLFTMDLASKKIWAVTDILTPQEYNAGVLLFNNELLQQEDKISDHLLTYARQHELVRFDQTVINGYFKNEIGRLPLTYNYQIGDDLYAYLKERKDVIQLLDQVAHPRIIHYSAADKPFSFLSAGRMRKTWWFYHNLNWPEIVQKYTVYDACKIGPQRFIGTAFIFTRFEEIMHLKEIVQALPELRFNIAAPTKMGQKLTYFSKFTNVKLYQEIIPQKENLLIRTADLYLDINRLPKEKSVLEAVAQRQIPILTFSSLASDQDNDLKEEVFPDQGTKAMIAHIKTIFAK